MNLLVLSSLYPNSKIYMSGIFVFEQVKELIKRGNTVTVFAPVPYVPWILSILSKKWSDYRTIPYHEIIDGVEIYHTRYLALPEGFLKQYWGLFYYIFMKRTVKRLHAEKEFELIHVHGSSPDDYGALLLSKFLELPYILTVHGESVYALYKNKSRFKNTKVAIEKADAVVGVSSKVVERIKKLTERKERLFSILNGYTPDESHISVERHNYQISILFSATLVERKGCKYLLEAFVNLSKKHNNILLTIAGGGELLEVLIELSEHLNIRDKVTFTGVVPHRKMLELMSTCDIFILPSWNEAFGVVYLEAMSFKKPVVGTLEEGITDVIKDGENGYLVKARDAKSIEEKLSLLIENNELREKIGGEGYESIKNLSWTNNAIKYMNLYEEVITTHNNLTVSG